MRAFQLTGAHATEIRDIATPDAGPGEVLVRVGAAGVCHSDLHTLEDPSAELLPMTLGHENAGWVESLGPGVTGYTEGGPVAVYGVLGCGHCAQCMRGRDNECQNVPVGGVGLDRDGGMASYLSVPARQLLPLGDLDVVQAAPLTDAGLTPYHAVEISRDTLLPGSTCVVIGIGGLGHMALQILQATSGVRVIAVDVNPDARALAERLGAAETVDASDVDTAVAHLRELVGGEPAGAEAVLDFVGIDPTLEIARRVIGTGGRLTLVGLGGGTLPVRPGVVPSLPFEVRTVSPFWGTRAELREVLALGARGIIAAQVTTFPLAEAATAYDQLAAGSLRGRGVVLPQE